MNFALSGQIHVPLNPFLMFFLNNDWSKALST
jgi:hypothetical protein